eukprot:4525917-Pyramimonas_sp.AAC.1
MAWGRGFRYPLGQCLSAYGGRRRRSQCSATDAGGSSHEDYTHPLLLYQGTGTCPPRTCRIRTS